MSDKVSKTDLRAIDMDRADMHIHTYYSDGQASPADIAAGAAALGLETIAVTDHDGVDGIREALEAGRREGINVIPGIELDTEDRSGVKLHILGYGMDVHEPGFSGAMVRLRENRRRRNEGLIKVLSDMGYHISLEELMAKQKGGYIGKPVIARALAEKGYIGDYREAFAEGRFFESPEVRAVKKERISSEEAISLIAAAGGTAVLAHPIQARGIGARGSEEFYGNIENIVTELAAAGLGGLECCHPDQDAEQTGVFIKMAEIHGLWITRGSDFHGSVYDGTDIAVPVKRQEIF